MIKLNSMIFFLLTICSISLAENKIKIITKDGVETFYNININQQSFQMTPAGSSYPFEFNIYNINRMWTEYKNSSTQSNTGINRAVYCTVYPKSSKYPNGGPGGTKYLNGTRTTYSISYKLIKVFIQLKNGDEVEINPTTLDNQFSFDVYKSKYQIVKWTFADLIPTHISGDSEPWNEYISQGHYYCENKSWDSNPTRSQVENQVKGKLVSEVQFLFE